MTVAMLGRGDQFQVLDAVIQSVVIDVVNVLGSQKPSSEVLLHHPPVLQ